MKRTGWLLQYLCVAGTLALCFSTAHAQFASEFQTNVISGVVSNWTGDYDSRFQGRLGKARIYNHPSSTQKIDDGGDGLPDLQATRHVTNLAKADTANDGSSDGIKMRVGSGLISSHGNLVTGQNNGPLCSGGILQLIATNGFGDAYRWTGPNNFSSTLQNPTISNVATVNSGQYCVSLTANGFRTQVCTYVTVNSLPTATVSGTTNICPGASASIRATLTGAAKWIVTWSDGVVTTNSSSPVTRTVNPSATTTYVVTALSDGNCSGGTTFGSATVAVSRLPSATITVPLSVCPGSTNKASVPDAGVGATYKWQVIYGDITGGEGTRSITWVANNYGVALLHAIVTTPSGCTVNGSESVSLECSTPALPWTNTFVRTSPPRIIMPGNNYTGLFTADQTNNIHTSDGSPLVVWKIVGNTFSNIYSGGGSNINLVCTRGWYAVQSADDRSGFGVLRNGCTRGEYSMMEDNWNVYTNMPVYTSYMKVITPYAKGNNMMWGYVETSPSNFFWRTADTEVGFDLARTQRVVAELNIRPTWQTNDADFIPEYTYFVKNLIQHFGTKLYAIIPWNEPDAGHQNFQLLGPRWGLYGSDARAFSPWWYDHYASTGADTNSWEAFYLQLVKACYNVKTQLHSNVKIIAGTTSGAIGYADGFLYWRSHGVTNYADAVAWHQNTNLSPSDIESNPPPPHTWGTLQQLQFFATNFPTMALWEDESHFVGDSALTGHAYTNSPEGWSDTLHWWFGYNRSVKDRILDAAYGVVVDYWLIYYHPQDMRTNDYSYDNGVGTYGWEAGRGIKLKAAAYLTTEDMVASATGFAITNDAQSVLVAWSKNGQANLAFWTLEGVPAVDTHQSAVTDVFGSPVSPVATEMPVFWTTNAGSFIALSNAWVRIHNP